MDIHIKSALSVDLIRMKIREIESAAEGGASTADLGIMIAPITAGYITSTSYLYGPFFRARKPRSLTEIRMVEDLWYPRKAVPQSRANESNAPVFYCSATDHIATREVRLGVGDRVVVLKCVLKNDEARPQVFSVGNFKSVIRTGKGHSGGRATGIFDFQKLPDALKERALLIDAFFARAFTSADSRYFNLTNAIAKFYLSSIEIDGLAYPSVQSNGGFNLALKASSADRFLKPESAYSATLQKVLSGNRLLMRRDFLATVKLNKQLSWYQAVNIA
jgi:hypothetical protein